MRTFAQRSDKFVFSVIMILSALTIWISSVGALPQQQGDTGDRKQSNRNVVPTLELPDC
jgi:hypothetical protein